MILNISSTVGLKDLIRDVEELLEEHLLKGLSNFEESNDDLSIRGVNIAITLLGRRRVMLRQLQQGTRVVSLEVQGSVNPDSGDSQFFICFDGCGHLTGQYTVWGQVETGMEVVEKIEIGEPPSNPDQIIEAFVGKKKTK